MALSRVVVMVCFLALLPSKSDTVAATNITAFVGQNVLLRCPCSSTADRVVWQIDEEIVVNEYDATEQSNTPPDNSYKHKSQLFRPNEKGNCSLLLFNVSFTDEKTFKCISFTQNEDMKINEINLTVEGPVLTQSNTMISPAPTVPGSQIGTVPVQVSVSLVAVVILTGGLIGTLLIRRRRQKTQRMEAPNQQTTQPMLIDNPV